MIFWHDGGMMPLAIVPIRTAIVPLRDLAVLLFQRKAFDSSDNGDSDDEDDSADNDRIAEVSRARIWLIWLDRRWRTRWRTEAAIFVIVIVTVFLAHVLQAAVQVNIHLVVAIGGVTAAVHIEVAFGVVIRSVPMIAGGLVTIDVGAHLHATRRDGDDLVRPQYLRNIVRRVTNWDIGRNVNLKVQQTSVVAIERTRNVCARRVHVFLLVAIRRVERAVHFATPLC